MVEEATGLATLHHVDQTAAAKAPAPGKAAGDDHPGGTPGEVSADLEMIQAQLTTSQTEADNLRKLADKLILLPGVKPDVTPVEVTAEARQKMVEDFEADPNAFIAKEVAKALEGNETIQGAKDTSDQVRADRAQEKLAGVVEDFPAIFASAGFKEFITKNPVYGRVLQAANAGYDVEAIAGVLNHYKGIAGEEGGTVTKTNPLNASKKSSSTGKSSGPILSRESIKKLAVEDPLGYAKMDAEITLAYKEGRVK